MWIACSVDGKESLVNTDYIVNFEFTGKEIDMLLSAGKMVQRFVIGRYESEELAEIAYRNLQIAMKENKNNVCEL